MTFGNRSLGRGVVAWLKGLGPVRVEIHPYKVAPRLGTESVRRRLLVRLYSQLVLTGDIQRLESETG